MGAPFEKLRHFLAGLKHPKHTAKNADPHQNTENHDKVGSSQVKQSQSQQKIGDSDGDPYAALSEVAAPEPVEPQSEEELAHKPSLEQRLSHTADSSGNHQNGYEALTEIAGPEPVERHTDAEAAQHPSLERRLSNVSH